MTSSKDWIIYSLRILAFCIGFFIIMDYIFTCEVETKKGHIIMVGAMFVTIIGFVIYRWTDMFKASNNNINQDSSIHTSFNF